jgi:NAD-dependent DNA ligase
MLVVLTFLEAHFPSLQGTSRKLHAVGAPIKKQKQKSKQFVHSRKMLSLDNAFTGEDLKRFCDRIIRKMNDTGMSVDKCEDTCA